jgi:hypothetical protein
MDVDPTAPTFMGARNASTTSAWTQCPRLQADRPFTPGFRSPALEMKELSGDTFETASSDPVAFIEGMEIVRIYVMLEEMPFVLLDALYTHLQDSTDLKEVHICIQSLLRAVLQNVHENLGLKRALTAATRKWAATRTALKFLFIRPDVATTCENIDGFQEVNLFSAIKRRPKVSVELTQILDQAELGVPSNQTLAGDLNNSNVGESGMHLDEHL